MAFLRFNRRTVTVVLCPSRSGIGNVYLRGFRSVRLSRRLIFAGVLLAWRFAFMESVKQLRHTFFGPMEYADALPAIAVLSTAPPAMVFQPVLPASSAPGGCG